LTKLVVVTNAVLMTVVTSLSASNSLAKHSRPPVASALVAADSYVLAAVDHPRSESYALALALSTPDSAISLRDPSTLTEKRRWTLHKPITQLKCSRDGQLTSCGKDGILHQWDERDSKGIALTITAPHHQPLLAFDCSANGQLIATGCEYQSEEAPILYWDTRSPNHPVRKHSDTHSDDITNLAFFSHADQEQLFSSSTDGLISLSNPSEGDEDEAVISVANWGTSISKMGFLQEDGHQQYIWCASDMETFSAWSLELDPTCDYGDVRNPRASLPGSSRDWKIDYVVDVLSSPGLPGGSILLGGTNQGTVGLIEFTQQSRPTTDWHLKSILSGHEGVVRSAFWDQNRRVLVTGGEDSKLNTWKIEAPQDAMDVDEEMSPPPRKRGFDSEEKRPQSKKSRVS